MNSRLLTTTSKTLPWEGSALSLNHDLKGCEALWAGLYRAAIFMVKGFTLDLRSLALFRMGLGVMALANVLIALSNVEAFYSDAGVYPRALLLGRQWESQGMWSLHVISGSIFFQMALLLLQGASAMSLALGYRTRLVTLLSWVLACSLETRNPAITNGADTVMRLFLLGGLLLPLGARWSLDNLKAGTRVAQESLLSLGTACLLLQMAFIYGFSAALKDFDLWVVQGNALMLALQLDSFTTPFGVWLRAQEELCRWLCRGVVVLEMIGPVLALLPIFRGPLRMAMVVVFISFHAGIALTMDIGAFPWIMMVAWCALLPPEFWQRLPKLGALLQSHPLLKHLPRTLAVDCPEHVRYGLQPGWKSRGLALACLLFVLMWNLRGTDFNRWEKIFPRSINDLAFVLRLDQHWAMFAPNPMLEDGWFVLKAELADGSEVDLLAQDETLSWDKPALLSATFKDSRWQKYLMNLWNRSYAEHRPWLGNYLAAKWNETHGGLSQVSSWEFFYMMEPTLMDGSVGEVEKHSLWKCQSFAGK